MAIIEISRERRSQIAGDYVQWAKYAPKLGMRTRFAHVRALLTAVWESAGLRVTTLVVGDGGL
jgi:hypothetical protein